MKRSEINNAMETAEKAFSRHHWVLPPNPRWDVTDFGLGDFKRYGLVCVNLAEEPEYCEKLMYVGNGQETPMHRHKQKKEDIICRTGRLAIQFPPEQNPVTVQVNGEMREVDSSQPMVLEAGERVTLVQELKHAFWADSEYAVVGEVSTANDDANDNFFDNPDVGRFSQIDEDEPPRVKLVSD